MEAAYRGGPGKISELVTVLDDEATCAAVEADLARFYPGVRLRQLFTGDLSWRELSAYLAHLPLESATQTVRLAAMTDADFAVAAAREHQHGPWSHADLLLATVADAVERLIFVQMRRAGATPDAPAPIPRPGVTSRKVRPINPAAAEYLQGLRAPMTAEGS